MKDLVKVIARAGLLPPQSFAEFKRWGVLMEEPPSPENLSAGKIIALLTQAMEEEGMVLVRETDLESLNTFIGTERLGTLVVNFSAENTLRAQVPFGITSMGEYLIPWTDEDPIEDLLVHPDTYLETPEGNVYFTSSRRLFFGNKPAFVVGVPTHPTPDTDPAPKPEVTND